jgi:hypothetical protein
VVIDTSSHGVARAFLEEHAMARTVRVTHEPDQALVHHFIRVVGRRPATSEELRQYPSAHSRLILRLSSRLRRDLARLISRL